MHVFCIFFICTCSAQLSMFHMERRSRNTLIIIIVCVLHAHLSIRVLARFIGLASVSLLPVVSVHSFVISGWLVFFSLSVTVLL